MTHAATIGSGFDDMENDLPEGTSSAQTARLFQPAGEVPAAAQQRFESTKPTYREVCTKCHGSGKFYSYTGRLVGECFHCKGKKHVDFKSSPEQRERERKNAAEKRASKALNNWAWFKEHFPNEAHWIENNQDFGFAVNMKDAVGRYGNLTDKQLDAIARCIVKQEQREAERAAKREATIKAHAAAPTVDVSRIEQLFDNARAKGLSKLCLRLDAFKFKPAPAHGANPGAIYVTNNDAEGKYLGKIHQGKLLTSGFVSTEERNRIAAAASDPSSAAEAYGKRTGQCCVCGRELTAEESIARNIGPICAGNYGL